MRPDSTQHNTPTGVYDDTLIGATVRQVIGDVLAYDDLFDRMALEAAAAIRAEGFRIVTHRNDHDTGTWYVLDAATLELLATGPGTTDMDDAWRADWYHEDRIFEADQWPPLPNIPAFIPAGLWIALRDWVEENLEDARRFIGTAP